MLLNHYVLLIIYQGSLEIGLLHTDICSSAHSLTGFLIIRNMTAAIEAKETTNKVSSLNTYSSLEIAKVTSPVPTVI
jgi:hypothetical protein